MTTVGKSYKRQLIIHESVHCSCRATSGTDLLFAYVYMQNLQEMWKQLEHMERWLSVSGKLSPDTQLLIMMEVFAHAVVHPLHAKRIPPIPVVCSCHKR